MTPAVRTTLVIAALLAVAALLYGPGLHGRYYGDDLFLVFWKPETFGPGHFFGGRAMYFFRPLDHAYVAAVQARVGLATWPIHVLGLAYHLAVVALTYGFGRVLRLSRAASLVAAAFVLVHEVAPYGVAGNDTLSQMGSAAWGMAAMVALGLALRDRTQTAWGWYGAALVAYTVALFYKETSAAFLPLAAVLACAFRAPPDWRRFPAWRPCLPMLAALLLPFGVLFIAYLGVRAQAITTSVEFDATQRYGLRLGLNIPVNLAQFAAAVLTTGSTVQTYFDVQQRAWGRLVFVGLGTLAFVVALLLGLRQSRAWRPAALLVVMALGACFPAALLNRVSELYVYNALPFVALLVGIAAMALWARAARADRGLLAVAAVALVLVHGLAVRQKVALMQARGEDAHRLMQQVLPAVQALPPGGRLLLRNAAPAPQYSVFVLHGIEVLRWAGPGVPRLAGRPDTEVLFADPAPATAGPAPEATRTLVFVNGRFVEARGAR